MKLFITLFVIVYIAGSINFSIILFRLLGKEDPRKNFSKNPGATNVRRQAGLFWAIVVLVFDMCRAAGVAWASTLFIGPGFVPWIGLGLVIGNRFPCFHGFRGGKGVANYLGFSMVFIPLIASFSGAAWGIVYYLFRIPFISSFVMVFILAAGMAIHCDWDFTAVAGTLATALFICYSHKSNIIVMLSRRSSV